MSTVYRILYRLGFTLWEHEPVEGPHSLPPSHMLDIGCGTGHDAIYAARHGWTVTGRGRRPRALNRAPRNAREAGVPALFAQADITRAGDAELGAGYALQLDSGCLHGLAPAQRQRAAATMTGAAESGATLLIFAFAPVTAGQARAASIPRR